MGIVRGMLKKMESSPARVTIRTMNGEDIEASANSASFHYGKTGTRLQDFSMGQSVFVDMVKSGNDWTLREMWDEDGWRAHTGQIARWFQWRQQPTSRNGQWSAAA